MYSKIKYEIATNKRKMFKANTGMKNALTTKSYAECLFSVHVRVLRTRVYPKVSGLSR
jgi:hypothetical protein